MLLAGERAGGEVLCLNDGLSFWGGVDPGTARIVDAHHPAAGQCVAGRVLLMPTSRGSCSGSGVLLELALSGRAPAAIVFREAEEVLTLGALVAERVFGHAVPVVRLPEDAWHRLSRAPRASISGGRLQAEGIDLALTRTDPDDLALDTRDRDMLSGAAGPSAQVAMEVLCRMAVAQGATRLTDVTRGHIDGCILAHRANLVFAERLAEMGARVTIPTTINAISVDRENWRAQGVPERFGTEASRLADAYVAMGARPGFTCAPYLRDPPALGECIGWSESNAVIYVNSVLGARTAKHPDYLDLFIAMTGRAPLAGPYLDAGRAPRRILDVTLPEGAGPEVWPLLGWLAGRAAPDRIPLLAGLEAARPSPDDLKALCAAFGTTSGAPMLHIAGHTPEAAHPPAPDIDRQALGPADFREAWAELNQAGDQVDLVAVGSPHASATELERMAQLIAGRRVKVPTIVTLGREVLAAAPDTATRLRRAGVRLLPDLCWCSITEPVFPPEAKTVLTTSGKYAHYGTGLTGRAMRLASLPDCVEAAITGTAPAAPAWTR